MPLIAKTITHMIQSPTMKQFKIEPIRTKGFTVVELIIVIVVIAILASIALVSYRSVTDSATTSQRVSDMNSIVKALEIYKSKHGSYPESSNNLIKSTDPNFLSALAPYMGGSVPVDPINNSTNYYQYFKWEAYDAGYGYCTRDTGKFYMLEIVTAKKDTQLEKLSPNFKCVTGPYSNDGVFHSYITGKMESN